MTLTKRLSTAAFFAATITAATGIHAQSVDLRVTGTINPHACTAAIGGGGIIDFGEIPAKTLNKTAATVLPTKSVPFSITCVAPTLVAVTPFDNRGDSMIRGLNAMTDDVNFGLGTAGDAKIGGYTMQFEPGTFTADGRPVFTVASLTDGATWIASTFGRLQRPQLRSWSRTAGGTPVAFSNLAGMLTVTAAINRTDALPITQKIELDGSATIELVYL